MMKVLSLAVVAVPLEVLSILAAEEQQAQQPPPDSLCPRDQPPGHFPRSANLIHHWCSLAPPKFIRYTLTGRPVHLPAANYVHMQVLDGLLTMRTTIDNQTIARVGDALLAGDFGRN